MGTKTLTKQSAFMLTKLSHSIQVQNQFEKIDLYRNIDLSDMGMSKLFSLTFNNVARYNDTSQTWYCYNGKYWEQDVSNSAIRRLMKTFTNELLFYIGTIYDSHLNEDNKPDNRLQAICDYVFKLKTYKNRETLIKDSQSEHSFTTNMLDCNNNLFNCQNGTLNLKTGEFYPHNSNDLLSKISNVVYDKDVKSKEFDKFVLDIMSGNVEKVKFLQKALGYCLSGNTKFECLFILLGLTTRNGKSTLMETFLHLMGDYGASCDPQTIAIKNSDTTAANEELANLSGKRFVNISEPDKALHFNAAKVKQLTGNDSFNVRRMWEHQFTMKPQFKLFIHTNHQPKITDDTLFTSNRVIVIPFERHFDVEEQNTDLKEILRKHNNISAFFNWAYQGYIDLYKENKFVQPKSVSEATTNLQSENDTIQDFMIDCLEKFDGNSKLEIIYKKYTEWCAETKMYCLNKKQFKEEMSKKGYIAERGRVDGVQQRNVVVGYKLISDDYYNDDISL